MERFRDSILELFYNDRKRKKVIGIICLLLTTIVLIIMALLSAYRNRPAERYEKEGLIELYYSWFSSEFSENHREMVYQIVDQDNETQLYVNGKLDHVCEYQDHSPALAFDINEEKASDEALTQEDSDIGVGKDIYHVQKSVAQKYLKYLQRMKGYDLGAYSATSKVWDSYLISQDKKDIIRFMYIYRTEAEGILICCSINKNAECPKTPQQWNEIQMQE